MSVKIRYQIPLIMLFVACLIGISLLLYSEYRNKQDFFSRMERYAGQWHEFILPAGTLSVNNGEIAVYGDKVNLPQYRSPGYREPIYRKETNNTSGIALVGYKQLGLDDLPKMQNTNYPFSESKLLVYWPRNYSGKVMILLHGWGFDPREWKTRSVVAGLAERFGVALVAPDMKKANYLSRWYHETNPQLKTGIPLPGILWAGAVLPAWIRGTFRNPAIHVAGYSTGARGALMVAAFFPDNFSGVGYISGDWDIVVDKGILYQMSYGSVDEFRKRWVQDNAACLVGSFIDHRVYAAHSAHDRTTPAFQTVMMKDAMERAGIICHVDIDNHGGHDWDYWNRKLPELFYFLSPE